MTDVTSPTIGKLAAALAQFQGRVENITKGSTAKIPTRNGGEYSYTYADLAAVLEAIRKPLSEAGLAVIQSPMSSEAGYALVSRVVHAESGEWAQSILPLPLPPNADAKALGSAVTYARRYALVSLLGLATEDDDGTAASEARQRHEQRRSATRPSANGNGRPAPSATGAPKAEAEAEAGGIGLDEAVALERFLSECGIVHALNFAKTTLKRNLEALSDLSPEDAKRVHDAAAERAAKAA